jgi:hypothetical protein
VYWGEKELNHRGHRGSQGLTAVVIHEQSIRTANTIIDATVSVKIITFSFDTIRR